MQTRFSRYLTLALLFAALPVRAEAQGVGGIINRAKKAVVDDNKTVNNPQLGEPFDAASLDAAIKGMRAYHDRTDEVASLQKQYLANQEKLSALQDKNPGAVDKHNEAKNKNHACVSDFQRANRRSSEEQTKQKMMAMMSDPAGYQNFVMEMARISQEQQAAVKKNDTLTVKKLQLQQEKLLGIDSKADSLAAVAKCGPPPQAPAVVAEIERLSDLSGKLNNRIRTTESASDEEAAKVAGVSPTRFQQMRERLTKWYGSPNSLGPKEGNLLNSRKKDIDELF
jgi:hypothetical protein